MAMDLTARTVEDTKRPTAVMVDIDRLLTRLALPTVLPERFRAVPTSWSDAPHR